MSTAIKSPVKIHKAKDNKTKTNGIISLGQIQEKLTIFNEALKTNKSLNTKTRKQLTTVGRERRAFTHNSLLIGINHPDLLPPNYQPEQLETWVADEQDLLAILSEVEILKRHIYDRYYELTHEEYQVALKIYRRVKFGAIEDESEMPALYESLKKFYRKSSSSKTSKANTEQLL